jgi:hypothetical protein
MPQRRPSSAACGLALSRKRRLVGFRHIQSGAGYCRCSPLEAHFGLGKSPAAGYTVEVFFPATEKRVVKKDVQPGQRLVITETD